MRALYVGIALAITSSAVCAEPDDERLKKQFKSDNYTVTWGSSATYDAAAELEVGDGSGHGFTLNWARFQPGKDGVDVLSIRLAEGRQPYESKWPPDRAPVTVKRARMKLDDYAALLRDLAVVNAAIVKQVDRNASGSSSNDFWVYARLLVKNKTLLDLNWAGYQGSRREVEYAKPLAAVTLSHEAVKRLDFRNVTLTEGERAWASAKFARDWKKFKDLEAHWWVRDRYMLIIGVVGDATALLTLRDILGGSKDSVSYFAINAVTRLTKKDVREKPVEEMDVEKTRRKVLELLRELM